MATADTVHSTVVREHRVRLKYPENDNYVELWQLIGSPKKYVGRYTAFGGEWVSVCDPLGYCEINTSFSPDNVFIICDERGHELFRSRNGDGSAHFNTLQQEAYQQMAEYLNKKRPEHLHIEHETTAKYLAYAMTGDPVGQFEDWLLSFQDPDIYPHAKTYPENWLYFFIEETGHKCLKTFYYLGKRYKIERIDYRHTYCGVTFSKILAAGFYIGAIWDEATCGTMYSKRQARIILTDAIKKSHPDCYTVSAVITDNGVFKEKRFKIESSWEALARGDIHRNTVDRLAQAEIQNSHFYDDFHEADKKYPGLVRDWTWLF